MNECNSNIQDFSNNYRLYIDTPLPSPFPLVHIHITQCTITLLVNKGKGVRLFIEKIVNE